MLRKITSYFIPAEKQVVPEVYRKYHLVVAIILITILFDLNYASTTILINLKEGLYAMAFPFFVNIILLFAIRKGLGLVIATNIYVFFGVVGILGSITFSGGFHSPVLPWLASSPIVAMLMAGRRSGYFWLVFNTTCILIFSLLSKNGYAFPVNYDRSWDNMFYTNCYAGLVLIIFFVSLVFETGKNTALTKLAEKNILLAEEKKKTALNHISQEIHDSVGQTLSVVKLNLHLLNSLPAQNIHNKLQETLALTGKAITELRNISHNLYVDNIQKFNLIAAIESELNTIANLGSFNTNFEIKGTPVKLDPKTEFVLFRIIKEALHNTLKHAQATSILIVATYLPDQFTLLVKDNGIGLRSNGTLQYGQGLINIQDRTILLGGRLQIDSKKDEGTGILVTLPLKQTELNQPYSPSIV